MCLRCILCVLGGDLGHFEEKLALSVVSLGQTVWVLPIRCPRAAVLHALAMLVVLISCMGREVDGYSPEVFL